MWGYGGVPILFYPIGGGTITPPGPGFLLLTDGTNLLQTDNTPLLLAG